MNYFNDLNLILKLFNNIIKDLIKMNLTSLISLINLLCTYQYIVNLNYKNILINLFLIWTNRNDCWDYSEYSEICFNS